MKKLMLFVLFLVLAGIATAQTPAPEVSTLTGTVTCFHCRDGVVFHKGYTQLTWALEQVGKGDPIVLVTREAVLVTRGGSKPRRVFENKFYVLQGVDQKQLLKLMEDKVSVTGVTQGFTLTVKTITKPEYHGGAFISPDAKK